MREQIIKPKFKIGEIVIVKTKDPQKIAQGKVMSSECFYDNGKQGTWFYTIKINDEGATIRGERIYTYECDTGNTKTKILSLNQQF